MRGTSVEIKSGVDNFLYRYQANSIMQSQNTMPFKVSKIKDFLKFGLKVLISVAALAYIVSFIDWKGAISIAKEGNIWLLLSIVLLLTLERIIGVFKWWLLLLIKNCRISYWRMFIINYVGGFWGLVLPSSVSSDIVRGYYLAKHIKSVSLTVATMALDRYVAVFALIVLGCISGMIVGDSLFQHARQISIAIFLFTILVSMLAGSRRVVKKIMFSAPPAWREKKWYLTLRAFTETVLEYKQHPWILVISLVSSFILQAIRVLIFYVAALAFGVQISVLYYFIFVPLILFLMMLPISFNGLGLREGGFVAFFALLGMEKHTAFVISFAVSLITTLTTAIGGIIYLLDKPMRHSAPEKPA
jgi:uncharacterized protein (TIRG00374 family)